jgi:hypothetical protein
VAATLVVFFGVLPDYLDQLRTICLDAACNYQQLTAGQLQTLNVLGWSLDQYVNLQVALYLVSISVSLVVSSLIVWLRPQSDSSEPSLYLLDGPRQSSGSVE